MYLVSRAWHLELESGNQELGTSNLKLSIMSFLLIRDLTYTYPNTGIRAVDGLNLDVEKGEVIAVIGPNAAGKSTFALLLKGLLTPDSGTLRIGNVQRVNTGPDPTVGILFSNPENQLVTSIVEEDVAFGLEVMGESSNVIQTKVSNVLEQLGIDHLKKRMPHLMSGGEQQMTALAGVLVLDPDIIILDEPTTYLDPNASEKVLAFMRYLADKGKIIFMITHDMKEAAAADRVVLLDKGCIVSDGAPDDVFNQPESTERYGISPPFLLSLVLGLRSQGIEARWPLDPVSLAGILKGRFKGQKTSPVFVDKSSRNHHGIGQALVYDNIRFGYGYDSRSGNKILDGVDFSVRQGSIALICGANGSGKSTLLQMSNGLVTPDSGEVILCGRPLDYWKKKRAGIPCRAAMMFQNPERQLFSNTVYDDIAFGPRNMGVSAGKIEERVLKAARWAGLPESILQRPVFTLSGGQMRRTAVAGILAMESEVLVLDEPTDGLDPGGTAEFYASARRYCDETGTTLLLAAHAVPEQITCLDHFGHLSDARMQSSGPPSRILTGSLRTLPKQFLPDHMAFREELLDSGCVVPEEVLDPYSVIQYLLDGTGSDASGQ